MCGLLINASYTRCFFLLFLVGSPSGLDFNLSLTLLFHSEQTNNLSSTSDRLVSMKRWKRWSGTLEWWWFFYYSYSQISLMVSPNLGKLPEFPFRMFTEVFSCSFVSPRWTDLSSSTRIQINRKDLFVAVACFIVSFKTMLCSTCFHYNSVLFLILCGLERVLWPNLWLAL